MNIGYGPDRRFFRLLSMIQGYDGYLIGKLSFLRNSIVSSPKMIGPWQNGSGGKARIQRQRKNAVILEVLGEEYSLRMTLLCPGTHTQRVAPGKTKRQDSKKKIVMSGNAVARHSFTTVEIFDFVQDVQDTNGIHRTADPVVPGLLMAEWFFSVIHSSDWKTAEIRFYMPAYAGQDLCLYRQSDRYDCLSQETGQLLWTANVMKV